MINLGVDFGSTYTMVSVYRNGIPETIQPDNLTFSYPSIVVYNTKTQKYFYGTVARNKIGTPNTVVFRGFKMLLNGQMSESELRKRNYDDINTPEHITELFLRYVITNTLKNEEEDEIGMLVLGAPECWFQSMETIDSRGILRDICMRASDKIGDVKIVSEPTNAAAYGVWCYENKEENKVSKRTLDGNILVIDYGGGTLDTAFVSVRHEKNNRLMIKPEMRSGRGQNTEGEIGKAGIAYQEAVVKRAIKDACGEDETIIIGEDFNKAVKNLEDMLVSNSGEVEEIFEENQLSVSMLKDEVLTSFYYNGKEVEVNYLQLKEVYNKEIYDVLNEVLIETTADVSREDENIHIALVGGFCNFYLVRQQIKEYFTNFFQSGLFGAKEKDLISRQAEREKAIAHGASLFAADVMSVCYVAQFGIGMFTYFADGKIYERYAINFGDEYVPDKVYFSHDDDGDIAPMMLTTLDTFLVNFTKNKKSHMPPMKPIKELAKRLRTVNCGFVVVVGFSIDARERITMHIYNYNNDPEHRGPEEKPAAVIPLKTFKESFQNTVIKKT